ncbi:flavin reductase family protein [Micromonospora sp. B11E3]|uniref:flavin reductase family protein n=1 Tax=Micromonospora sp. B11E3 TaxID=3153562 RepID=UPI00325F3B2E
MTTQERTVPSRTEVFTEAMARLASGVAVVTSRQPDGAPCGLLVSSICSYSVRPPSVLVSIGRESRSYRALLGQAEFGVHLLGSGDGPVAQVFAGRGDDKFAGLDWGWDDLVPRLHHVPVYLRCLRRRVFEHGDHAILIGEVADGEISHGEPLVYYRRALDWRLEPPSRGPR